MIGGSSIDASGLYEDSQDALLWVSSVDVTCILFWQSEQDIRNLVTASLGKNAYVSAIWSQKETQVVMNFLNQESSL